MNCDDDDATQQQQQVKVEELVVFFCGVIHVVTAMHVLLYVMANTLRVYLLMSRSSAQPEDLASTHR